MATPSPSSFEIYVELKEYEHHFNKLQDSIRRLASAWLLVALGAIAFVVRGDLGSTGTALVDAATAVNVVCLLAVAGIVVLWVLDKYVYQTLLQAAFALGLRMELANPALPPVRTLMWIGSSAQGMGRLLDFYYLVPVVALTTIALFSLLVLPTTSPSALAIAAFALMVLAATASVWIRGQRRYTVYQALDGLRWAASPTTFTKVIGVAPAGPEAISQRETIAASIDAFLTRHDVGWPPESPLGGSEG